MDLISIISGLIGAIGGSIIGALITGSFTLKIAEMNLKESRKNREEDLNFYLHQNRPEFEIVQHSIFKDFHENNNDDMSVCIARIEGFDGDRYFKYSKKLLENKNLEELSLEIKNIGKTDISEIWIAINACKSYSIFEFNSSFPSVINNGYLSYAVCHDKIIRVNDTVKIRFLQLKTNSVEYSFSARITIWIKDVNGNWWSQPYFYPFPTIYESKRKKSNDFELSTSEEKGLECFRNPILW